MVIYAPYPVLVVELGMHDAEAQSYSEMIDEKTDKQ
jgi:hypothetical protein